MAMVFLAMVVLGTIGIYRMPVELFPEIEGNQIFISFTRPGSTLEVVEREIFLPLQSRVRGLGGVIDTQAQLRGSGGNLAVTFHPLTNMKIREYEVKAIASALQRQQDRNTARINVGTSSFDFGDLPVMELLVTGQGLHSDTVFDLAKEKVQPAHCVRARCK